MIRVGIWGCGGISTQHRNAYRILEEEGYDVKLVALCDINPESFNKQIKINISTDDCVIPKIDNCYTDIDEMLNKENLDLVDICLPAFLHKDCAIKILKKNINVLLEKPMALSLEESKEIEKAQKESSAQLMVAHCVRFGSFSAYLKKIIQEEKYGKLISADFSRVSPRPLWKLKNIKPPYKKQDGVLLDLSIHDIDLVNYLFGEPESIAAMGERGATYCDSIITLFKYKTGMVTIRGDWGLHQTHPFTKFARICFENATIESDCDGNVTLYEDDKSTRVEIENNDVFVEEIRYFIEGLTGRHENTVNPVESTIKTMELIEKIDNCIDL
ncbi:MAG: Gfo/Idh/MocA family oxidoreductase [Clostridia bacterium]|nr:Gfo/Idh/MocA family oxidoreductase [Clostridia bacterium]